ncbi:response regulator transcription factor [Intrasporangium calvum]|uniref:Two component transcriptional regulator, winged helix family n=1 Tax=Intrasporangium calvum (strain ATCC 23552 / DSM 43043 / JCM 3097 / NBRC 12989 / NCIMB 10167 / NRRL B-3866 / 7 KIP) TaxID=710696 RepID=E6SBH5_INTC7|nr:response regulator transcription factor [Intrasporangium calvum]ADU49503.1 two component transcriptional regulator, winged helix family [Intrasporangium calvum DSM 43043]AXG15458.1 DNA-binding response regulator [Intrasporangium calvum]
MRVLVVEDERPLAAALRRSLESEGFSVVVALNGVDGDWQAQEQTFDVIVLDVMLPGMSGYDICRNVRARDDSTPIVFLTAKDGEYDEADALDIGGDDFISKPFSPVVLAARLRALLRRAGEGPEPSVVVGSLRLEPAKQRAWLGADELRLTAREMALVRYLAHRVDHVVSKTEILEHVWDQAFEGDANVVEVYIGRLRRKLATQPDVAIETVRGLGYRLSGRGA